MKLALGLLTSAVATLMLGPGSSTSFLTSNTLSTTTMTGSRHHHFRGQHTNPIESAAPSMVMNTISAGHFAAQNERMATLHAQVEEALTLGNNRGAASQPVVTMNTQPHKLLQLTRGLMKNRFRAWVNTGVVRMAVPIIAPKFRRAFQSLPDAWVLEFAKTTMRDMNIKDLQDILNDKHLPNWFVKQSWWIGPHLDVAKTAFDKLPENYVIKLTRSMIAGLSDEEAGKMFLDIPKNVMKNFLRKHGQEKALENLLFRIPMLSFALRCVRDGLVHKSQGAAFTAILNIAKGFRP